jgi:hypothetical protein
MRKSPPLLCLTHPEFFQGRRTGAEVLVVVVVRTYSDPLHSSSALSEQKELQVISSERVKLSSFGSSDLTIPERFRTDKKAYLQYPNMSVPAF